MTEPRTLTEPEVRAALAMFWHASQYARRTVALWHLSKKKPRADDMLYLALQLKGAEDSVQRVIRGEGSIANFDSQIAFFATRLQELG